MFSLELNQSLQMRAAEMGHTNFVINCFCRNSDVNGKNVYDQTALILAAKYSHFDLVDSLTDERECDLDHIDIYGNSALGYAVMCGCSKIEQHLRDLGATCSIDQTWKFNTNTLKIHNGDADIDMTKVNDFDDRGITPLIEAVLQSNVAIVQKLLEGGADVNLPDSNDRTPLSWAAEGTNLLIIKLLLRKGADINAMDKNGNTPLGHACRVQELRTVQYLAGRGADLQRCAVHVPHGAHTPLMWACMGGNPEVVAWLLRQGAKLNVCDSEGNTPLSYAVFYGHVEVVRLLLAHGADPCRVREGGLTPLICAVLMENAALVEILLKKGATLTCYTALPCAIEVSDLRIVRLILMYSKPRFDVVNARSGLTDLSNALQEYNNNIVKELIHHNANLNQTDESDIIPLMKFVEDGNYGMVKFCLKYGANVNVRNKSLATPLQLALEGGFVDIFKLLIDHGSDIHEIDKNSKSLLAKAAEMENLLIVKLLIEKGADVERAMKELVEFAEKNRDFEMYFSELQLEELRKRKKFKVSQTRKHGECIICCDKLADCVVYKCGHLCMCVGCAHLQWRQFIGYCPVCRTRIIDVIQVYT